jgi:hypothetical protein
MTSRDFASCTGRENTFVPPISSRTALVNSGQVEQIGRLQVVE